MKYLAQKNECEQPAQMAKMADTAALAELKGKKLS